MENAACNKHIYIVITQTGTILSRILKFITHAEYNHVSIGLDPELDKMYSFGRKCAYYPFWGGFVTESTSWGTFKRFSKTKAVILKASIEPNKHKEISDFIFYMKENKKKYRYNYWGLIMAGFKVNREYKNRFYCSEFVKYILQKFNITGSENLMGIVQPIHFLQLPYERIYNGTLKKYTDKQNT